MDVIKKNISWRMYVLLITCVMLCMNQANGDVVINEIKLWGNPLFIELKINTSDTTVKSHNYTAVIYNSTTDISYKVIKHSSMMNSFYIEDLAKKDLPDPNGTYAVALYWRNSSVEDQNFVNITTVNLIDAVVYRFTKNDDSNLGIPSGLNRTESYLVNVSANTSLSKCGGSYQLTTPTPNAPNNCSDSTGSPKSSTVSITAAHTATTLPKTPVSHTTNVALSSTNTSSSPSTLSTPVITKSTLSTPVTTPSVRSSHADTGTTSNTSILTVPVAPTNETITQSTTSPKSSSPAATSPQSTTSSVSSSPAATAPQTATSPVSSSPAATAPQTATLPVSSSPAATAPQSTTSPVSSSPAATAPQTATLPVSSSPTATSPQSTTSPVYLNQTLTSPQLKSTTSTSRSTGVSPSKPVVVSSTIPTSSPAIVSTTAPVPSLLISELNLLIGAGKDKLFVELIGSSNMDLAHYSLVIFNGESGSVKCIFNINLKEYNQTDEAGFVLIMINRTITEKLKVLSVALYDNSQWEKDVAGLNVPLEAAGLVDVFIHSLQPDLVDKTVTDTMIKKYPSRVFIADPEQISEVDSLSTSRCANTSNDPGAFIVTKSTPKKENICTTGTGTKIQFRLINASCKDFRDKHLMSLLLDYIVKKVGEVCRCGVSRYLFKQPKILCGSVIFQAFLEAAFAKQSTNILALYNAFVKTTKTVKIGGKNYQVDTDCNNDCVSGSNNDNKIRVTIGVVVSCIAMFLLVVLVVVLYMKRKRRGILQFRMTRLDEDDDDLINPEMDDFVGEQDPSFNNPLYSNSR